MAAVFCIQTLNVHLIYASGADVAGCRECAQSAGVLNPQVTEGQQKNLADLSAVAQRSSGENTCLDKLGPNELILFDCIDALRSLKPFLEQNSAEIDRGVKACVTKTGAGAPSAAMTAALMRLRDDMQFEVNQRLTRSKLNQQEMTQDERILKTSGAIKSDSQWDLTRFNFSHLTKTSDRYQALKDIFGVKAADGVLALFDDQQSTTAVGAVKLGNTVLIPNAAPGSNQRSPRALSAEQYDREWHDTVNKLIQSSESYVRASKKYNSYSDNVWRELRSFAGKSDSASQGSLVQTGNDMSRYEIDLLYKYGTDRPMAQLISQGVNSAARSASSNIDQSIEKLEKVKKAMTYVAAAGAVAATGGAAGLALGGGAVIGGMTVSQMAADSAMGLAGGAAFAGAPAILEAVNRSMYKGGSPLCNLGEALAQHETESLSSPSFVLSSLIFVPGLKAGGTVISKTPWFQSLLKKSAAVAVAKGSALVGSGSLTVPGVVKGASTSAQNYRDSQTLKSENHPLAARAAQGEGNDARLASATPLVLGLAGGAAITNRTAPSTKTRILSKPEEALSDAAVSSNHESVAVETSLGRTGTDSYSYRPNRPVESLKPAPVKKADILEMKKKPESSLNSNQVMAPYAEGEEPKSFQWRQDKASPINAAMKEALEGVARSKGQTLDEYVLDGTRKQELPSHGTIVETENIDALANEHKSFAVFKDKTMVVSNGDAIGHYQIAKGSDVASAGEIYFTVTKDANGQPVLSQVDINLKSGNYRIEDEANAFRAAVRSLLDKGLRPGKIVLRSASSNAADVRASKPILTITPKY